MIRKSLLPLIAFFFVINATLFAQNLLKYIPEDATFVITFNPSALNAKIPFSKLKEFDFFKMGMKEMAKEIDRSDKDEMLKLLNDPASIGMDLMASSYIFGKMTDEGNAFSILFKLSDAAKFTEFFKSKLSSGIEIVSVDGFNMITPDQDMAFAWTNDFALITGVEVHRSDEYGFDDYYYDDEEIIIEEGPTFEEIEMMEEEMIIEEEAPGMEEIEIIKEVVVIEESPETGEVEIIKEEVPVYEEELMIEGAPDDDIIREEMDYLEEEWVDTHDEKERTFTLDWVKKVMSSDGSASVMKNPKFMLANAKKTDANLWLDYASIYDLYLEEFAGMSGSEMAMVSELMGGMYKDTYMSMGLNFDAGFVNFNMDSYANSQMMKFYREATDAKFNKKFYKYIPGESLMGYWSFNMNVENTVKGYKDLFLPMLQQIPMYGNMANDMMGIMDIFVDEEAIYDLWKGDMLFAVTGLKDFERTITSYEYDDDFNKTETQQTVTRKLPEFVMMSSYGNEENVLKFIKLGEKTPFLENKGSYYKATIPEINMDVYIALHKGILFFTNNLDLVENRLSTGYSKKERMNKTQSERIKNNSMVFYWDIPQSLNAASEFGIPLEGPQGKILIVSKNSFESIIWTAPKGGVNAVSQMISLNFVNKEMNSMEQIFNYVNEIVMTMMGGTSM